MHMEDRLGDVVTIVVAILASVGSLRLIQRISDRLQAKKRLAQAEEFTRRLREALGDDVDEDTQVVAGGVSGGTTAE